MDLSPKQEPGGKALESVTRVRRGCYSAIGNNRDGSLFKTVTTGCNPDRSVAVKKNGLYPLTLQAAVRRQDLAGSQVDRWPVLARDSSQVFVSAGDLKKIVLPQSMKRRRDG